MAHIVGVPKRDPCQKCGLPVFLAERLMIGKNVYHRTCLRCARCNSQLTPGNFYETEIDGEYCCETCPDEEKKLDVATSSKDRALESVKSKSIASQLAFFEKDGTMVLQKSLSDEEKSQSLKKLTENQLQYIYKPNSARSNFLNNPSSGEYDSHNSSRRNSDSSSGTTSSDKTNDDVSKEPPELPKSLPPLLLEDETHGATSFHIQESTKSTKEHDNKPIAKISNLQNTEVETTICDMSFVGHVPSVIDAPKTESKDTYESGVKAKSVEIEYDISGALISKQDNEVPDIDSIQIKTYFYDDQFSSRKASIKPLTPPNIRYKSGANIREAPSKASSCENLRSQPICAGKSSNTMDLKHQDRLSSGFNVKSKVKSQSLEIKPCSEDVKITGIKSDACVEIPQNMQLPSMRSIKYDTDVSKEKKKRGISFVDKNEIDTLSQEPHRGTKNSKLSTGPCDQQQDNDAEFCNDLNNLIKHSINVTKDNSENDGEMRIINIPSTCECIKELLKPDEEQSVVNSERSNSMVRTRLHQFEDIANKSQNSSISSISKNRLSHSANSSRTCNVEDLCCEKELCTVDLESSNECSAADTISNKMEKHASCTVSEKIPGNQFDSSKDKSDKPDKLDKSDEPDIPDDFNELEKSDVLDKSDELDNSIELEKSYTSDKLDESNNLDKLEKSDVFDKSDEPDNSDKSEKSATLADTLDGKLEISDTSDKSDKPDNLDKLEKSDTSDKLDKPDKLDKLEESDTSDKLASKVGLQKKTSDAYPEELNPFKSDEEEDNQSSPRKTNPFDSSDEDEKKDKVTHSNPFGSESEDENVSNRSGKLPVPTPRMTKSSEKITPVVTQTAMWRASDGVLQNNPECCGAVHVDQYQNVRTSEKPTHCSCARAVAKNRKKKPAPQPPKVSKEIFSSINQDSKKSSPGSSTASTPTTMRKKRPAPSPPDRSKTEGSSQGRSEQLLTSMEATPTPKEEMSVEKPQLEKLCDEEKALLENSTNISSNEPASTTLDQGNESMKTSKRRLIALDASLVEDANSSEDLKLKEEDNVIYRRTLVPPVLDDSTLSPSSDTSESHDRQLEKMKDNKEAKNRNRQSQISLPSEENDPLYNKSVHGKWKRRKGPAPALPIPPKKVLQMLPLQEIRHELEIIEVQQQGLEKQGVMLEKMIRERCEGPTGGDNTEAGSPTPPNSKEVEDLILQLFELVNEKNELFRRQAELMYLRRQHRLEQEQADLEYEIRVLMAQPERNKTDSDKAREEALIARLVEVVQLRNEVVECLEMDRLREAEEDLSIKQRLEMHSAKRDEELSKQTPTKLSKKEKKKQKEHKKIGKSKKLDADKDADESELNAEKQKAKKKKKKFLF